MSDVRWFRMLLLQIVCVSLYFIFSSYIFFDSDKKLYWILYLIFDALVHSYGILNITTCGIYILYIWVVLMQHKCTGTNPIKNESDKPQNGGVNKSYEFNDGKAINQSIDVPMKKIMLSFSSATPNLSMWTRPIFFSLYFDI